MRCRTRLDGLAAAAVAVLALATSVPASHAGGGGVDGYPQRIGFESSPDPLPRAPGPLAGVFFNNSFGAGFFVGVSASGELWKIGQDKPALSHDGTRLLLAEPFVWKDTEEHPSAQRLVLHNLVSGERRVYRHLMMGRGTTVPDPAVRFEVDPHHPVVWSADNSSALLVARERNAHAPWTPRVLDVATGELTEVAPGLPAGFRSPDEVVTVREAGSGVTATTTDLLTGVTTTQALDLDGPWLGDKDQYLRASISGDGRTLLLVEDPEGTASVTLRLFSLPDGRELEPRKPPRGSNGCALSWLGRDPVVAMKREGEQATSVVVTPERSRRLVSIHFRSQAFCIWWASDALEGGPAWSLFGTSTAKWTWYWYLGVPLLAVPLLVVALLVRRWSRR